jgi:predicted nucleic acid-binding protein
LITGLDSNILCYALDPDYPEHKQVKNLLLNLSPNNIIVLNSTIVLETYHVLVFYLQWFPKEAAEKLTLVLSHPHVQFFNQTKSTSELALSLSVKYDLGGRDALIVANFLANKVPILCTHDSHLLKLKEVTSKNASLTFRDPITERKA